jgi:hypothetical protein
LIVDAIAKSKMDCRTINSLQTDDHVITQKLKNQALQLALSAALNEVPIVQ